MGRVLTALIVLAVLVGAGSFAAAPFVAFYALRSAAEAEDVQGLSKLVDFDAVRASLAPQLDANPGVQAPPPSVFKDPLGAIKRAIEPAIQPMRGPKADDYLTPRALARLTHGAGRDAWKPASGEPAKAQAPEVSHWGVNRTRLSVENPSKAGEVTVFTFDRRGPFDWKLAHVGLPSDEKAAPAPAAAKPAA